MLKYVGVRVLAVLPVVALVVVIVFLLLHLAPGDPAALVAGENASPEQVALIRQRLHLDEPILTQFWLWVRHLALLDLGNSIFSNQPVTKLIAQRIEPTLMLAATTTLLTVAFAVPAGVIAAWKNNTPVDRGVMVMSVAGFSVPVFVLGYALMYVFSIKLHWLPVQGYKPLAVGFWACLRSLVLPSIALALVFSALVARVTRAAMLDILSEDYIRTAAAKGARTPRVLLMHALKNAGRADRDRDRHRFSAGLIGGVVVTESVFNIPGHRPFDRRRHRSPRLSGCAGRHTGVLGRADRNQSARGSQLFAVRSAHPLLRPDVMSSLSELSAAAAIETDDDEPERKRRPIEASAIFCAAVLVVFVLVALLSPSLVGDYRSLDTGSRLLAPSAAHWFGTDHLGRDIFARTTVGVAELAHRRRIGGRCHDPSRRAVRTSVRIFPPRRRSPHASDGRHDGDPRRSARHRAGVVARRRPADRDHRHYDSRDSPHGEAGAQRRPHAAGTIVRHRGHIHRHVNAQDPGPPHPAQRGGYTDGAGRPMCAPAPS